jgi:hypothetical protein
VHEEEHKGNVNKKNEFEMKRVRVTRNGKIKTVSIVTNTEKNVGLEIMDEVKPLIDLIKKVLH